MARGDGYVWTETYDPATVAFIILGAALVFFMVPGLGFYTQDWREESLP